MTDFLSLVSFSFSKGGWLYANQAFLFKPGTLKLKFVKVFQTYLTIMTSV